jgi:hypothetical protein
MVCCPRILDRKIDKRKTGAPRFSPRVQLHSAPPGTVVGCRLAMVDVKVLCAADRLERNDSTVSQMNHGPNSIQETTTSKNSGPA